MSETVNLHLNGVKDKDSKTCTHTHAEQQDGVCGGERVFA